MESLILNRSSISNGGPGSGKRGHTTPKFDELEHAKGVRAIKDLGGQVPQKFVNQADKTLQKHGVKGTERAIPPGKPNYIKTLYEETKPVLGDVFLADGGKTKATVIKIDKTPTGTTAIDLEVIGKKKGRVTTVYTDKSWISNSYNHLNLVANFSGNIRRETLGGRKFIVAPLTMIVPGVLNGSQGPLYYPEDEVVASTPHWDGIILTDDHLPSGVNGKKIKTQQEYALGYVQDPQISNGKLMAEGWFDVDRTRRINPAIIKALEQGDKIELSTGLSVDFDNTAGVHNGRSYNQVVRKYRPDHLAVLIGKRGACSLTDGCGVNNNMETDMLDQDELDTEDFDLDIEQDDDVDNEWSEQARLAAAEARRAHSSGKSAARLKKISIQGAHVALQSKGYKLEMAQQTAEDMKGGHTMYHLTHPDGTKKKVSADHIRGLIAGFRSGKVGNEEVNNTWSDAARKAAALKRSQITDSGHSISYHTTGKGRSLGVAAVIKKDGKVVHTTDHYTGDDDESRQMTAIDDAHAYLTSKRIFKSQVKNGTTLPTDASGKVIKGKKKTKKKVIPSDCSYKEVNNNTKEHTMLTEDQKNELIDNVINNCACYTEDDRDTLTELDDRMLSSIANGIEAEKKVKKEKETVNNAEAPKTIDIKALPAEVQRVINYGAAAIQRDKEAGITRIVTNAGVTGDAEKAMREKLAKKSFDDIQEIVSLLPAEKVDNSTFDLNRLVGNFSGAAAGGFKVANESGPAGGQLGMPEIQWNKN